ncbi:MAG: helix-turn-helix domain-containing protein [Alphaproteobacteria bacterium]|nr:helix-turn-helix domain-containing protein [Alphaproteobacteria bacterium]
MGARKIPLLALLTLPSGCAGRRLEQDCPSCGAAASRVCGSTADASLARLEALAEPVMLDEGAVLIREGDKAPHVFNITSGSVRVFKRLPNGRRQIIGFLFRGDFLGLAVGDTYVFTAEAMEPSSVCRFRKAAFRALIQDDPPLEHALLNRTTHELAAAQNQMLLLGRKTAIERLASFLLDLPSHDLSRPAEAGHVRLPMSRGEIADYLGLTIETVSRVLTRLKTQGVIRLVSQTDLLVERPDLLRAHADGDL